jgi:hypothetical protein
MTSPRLLRRHGVVRLRAGVDARTPRGRRGGFGSRWARWEARHFAEFVLHTDAAP